jgi:cytochrome b subunit of formate dehydrogenase
VRWVRRFYLVLIPLVVGLMLLHNSGDWARKLIRVRLRPGVRSTEQTSQRSQPEEHRGAVRMHSFERLQHALLTVCFTILVWRGFALKYPDDRWARPLSAWEAKWPVRGTLHHIAAAFFMTLVVVHILSLIKSQRLRRHWLELRPRRADVGEGLHSFAFNLGLRSEPPRVSAYCYVEKIEYWAVAWGAGIMIVTGLMLWAHNLVLAWLPKSALDVAVVAHFYEAVLAVLSVLIWHSYAVIFDLEVFPMDTAWLKVAAVGTGE